METSTCQHHNIKIKKTSKNIAKMKKKNEKPKEEKKKNLDLKLRK